MLPSAVRNPSFPHFDYGNLNYGNQMIPGQEQMNSYAPAAAHGYIPGMPTQGTAPRYDPVTAYYGSNYPTQATLPSMNSLAGQHQSYAQTSFGIPSNSTYNFSQAHNAASMMTMGRTLSASTGIHSPGSATPEENTAPSSANGSPLQTQQMQTLHPMQMQQQPTAQLSYLAYNDQAPISPTVHEQNHSPGLTPMNSLQDYQSVTSVGQPQSVHPSHI